MALKTGIVGLPNVGKSTLFNALSSAKAQAANFPFCTIEPNVGVVAVPDKRLDILQEIVKPEKVIPTTIEFVDIAGLVKGASKGEGLGNQFLANIREVNAIVHVVRCFDDDQVVHVDGSINPVRDKEIIDTELQLKDLETIEKRFSRTEKIAKAGDKTAKLEFEVLQKMKAALEEGTNIRTMTFNDAEKPVVTEMNLLTYKPVIYVVNVDEASVLTGNQHVEKLKEAISSEEAVVVQVSAAIESQIAELEDLGERMLFLNEYGLEESGLTKLIRATYEILDLITFFTAGPKEVKAWTIRKGWKAPAAAGVIHSDFEKGFIKAEVIRLEDYQHYQTEAAIKEAGKMAIQGKEYVVKDGDIIYFRFNV